jgi:mannosyltransferase OCH1-like enzyme
MRRTLHITKWISPIPKKIHFIWIGTAPLPDYFTKFLEGFRLLNPEFEIKIWRNKDITQKNFPKVWSYLKQSKKKHGDRIKEFTKAQTMYNTKDEPYTYNKYAQQVDLLRLEVIYNEGGYYFDTTFECLQPLYKLFNRKEAFVGCNEVPRFKDIDFLSNSFFGATKGNPILRRLLMKSTLDAIDFKSANVAKETGPYYLRSGIHKKDNVHIFPYHYFYPFMEKYGPNEEPPYRKSSFNKCHGSKRTKKRTLRLQHKKGWLEYPCKKYPKSYALKHWQLGKSWLIDHYYVREGSKRKLMMGGGPAPCIPCMAALPTISASAAAAASAAASAAAGACVYGIRKAGKHVMGKNKKKKKKKTSKKKK